MTGSMELGATIGELSPGGDGVAVVPIDGERRAVFVPGVLRGERVRLSVDASRRPARGTLLELLEPSPERVVPACPVVSRCGGCDWMHLSAKAQAEGHAAIVRAVLPAAYGDVSVVTHAAPKPFGYRTRARVHVTAERGRMKIGMFARGSHVAAEVDACAVLEPALEAARRSLSPLLAGARGRGEASLALGRPRGDATPAVLELRWSSDLPAVVFARLEAAVRAGTLAGARVFQGDVRAPATVGDPTPWVVAGDSEPLRLSPGGFGQAADGGNRLLAVRVAELARALVKGGDGEPAKVVELYAGAGNLTVLLARDFAVTAVESDPQACVAAQANLAARGLAARAKVHAGDAATYAVARGTKLVVLDPPRVGARDVARALAALRVPAILYVSCDPATLGRDLECLADAYALEAVETFEMFPQTSHVETVCALVRRRR